MEDFFTRLFENFGIRVSGPMKFRFILQPLVALIFAIKAGYRDSKEGVDPYMSGLLKNEDERRELLKQTWSDVGKVFIIALIMDLVFQIIILKEIYPLEAFITAILLAFVPYFIFRGPVNRIINLIRKNKKTVFK